MKFTFTRKRNEDEDYSSFNGDDSYYNLRSLNVFVSRLRGYLADDSRIEIQSIRGVGYRLIIRAE